MTYFLVVLAVLESEFFFGASLSKQRLFYRAPGLMVVAEFWRIGQTEITAQYVDALLPLQLRCLICSPGHGIHSRHPHGDVSIAKLLGCGTEAFNESALFKVALPSVCHNKGNHTANSSSDSQRYPR